MHPRLRRRSDPVVAVVAAAGRGERAGSRIPKQFLIAGGRTLLERAVRGLAAVPEIDAVVVVVPASRLAWAGRRLGGARKVAAVVPGGRRRQDSVAAGLAAAPGSGGIVLVHDAARPLVPAAVVRAVIAAARRHGAAVPGVTPPDTVKEVDAAGRVTRTIPRARLRLIQTPQGFRRAWLAAAFDAAGRAGREATDDAALVEATGRRVRVVPGSPMAFKITTKDDVRRARALISGRRRP